MRGMASQLSEATLGKLAGYFEKQQPPAPGKSVDAALGSRGKKVFEEDVPAAQTQPCASCHGANGAHDRY